MNYLTHFHNPNERKFHRLELQLKLKLRSNDHTYHQHPHSHPHPNCQLSWETRKWPQLTGAISIRYIIRHTERAELAFNLIAAGKQGNQSEPMSSTLSRVLVVLGLGPLLVPAPPDCNHKTLSHACKAKSKDKTETHTIFLHQQLKAAGRQ